MIQFTYEDILGRLKNNLQSRLNNTGLLFYSANQKILEAIAEELQEEMRYNEYLTRESKWSLAKNRSSIMYQSEFFNYRPYRKNGSVGDIRISTSQNFNGTYLRNIPIPKFTQFSADDVIFTSTTQMNLLSNQTSIFVPVVQGQYRMSIFEITQAYTEAELLFLELEENNDSIENNVYEVRVNGELWTEINDFNLSPSSSSKVFVMKNKPDFSGVIIQFGDNIQSKKLEYGDLVTFQYVETLGTEGEILQTNAINTVIDEIKDVQGRVVTLYCRNESEIAGGSDYESIDSIREKAPKSFSLISRIITKEDYKTFIVGSEIVDKASVWGETERNQDLNRPLGTFIEFSENLINVSALSYSKDRIAIPATEAQRDAIRETLLPVKGLTDIINFVEPLITFLKFDVTAYYDNKAYSPEQVKEAVLNALETEYEISSTDFKESLYFSQYYELINRLPEVEYHSTDLFLIQYIQNSDTIGSEAKISEESGNYYFYLETFHRDILEGTLKIYVKNIDGTLENDHPHKNWSLIATDDREGSFIGEKIPDYFEPSPGDKYKVDFENPGTSELRYEYGSVCDILGNVSNSRIYIGGGMDVDSQNNYIIKLEFQAGTEGRINVIPTHRKQIFAFEGASISTDIVL